MAERAVMLVDLGFGDAGKGSMTDYLARVLPNPLVVRFNGGSQAGHNVVLPDGRHHTFSSFGSGTFVPGVRTHLSEHTVIHPMAMMAEERHLREKGVEDAWERTTLSRDALIVTPFQQALNRLRELSRGDARHGSCGLGIGETVADSLNGTGNVIRARDLEGADRLRRKLGAIQAVKYATTAALDAPDCEATQRELGLLREEEALEWYYEAFTEFGKRITLLDADEERALVADHESLIFEGAQGVLIDEDWGFHPHTSWGRNTFRNAESLLQAWQFDGVTERVGVTRPYMVRHGAGPLPTEDPAIKARVEEPYNVHNDWQQDVRFGWFDGVLLRYAIEACGGVDGIALTHVPFLGQCQPLRLCWCYTYPQCMEPWWNQHGNSVLSLRATGDRDDLGHRERFTRMVGECEPVYDEVDDSLPVGLCYPEMIEHSLGVPLLYSSNGPTWEHKHSYQKVKTCAS